jgi:uncharacterized protein YprB with RNaseH-like and TPR domain
LNRRGALSGRLNRLKKEGLSPPLHRDRLLQRENDTGDLHIGLPPGWNQICPHVWRRTVLRKNILRSEFNDSLILPEGAKSTDLIFYDTETTGLSTGAGTIPFLIGLGCLRENSFEIIQYFLSDYPGEPELLQALKKDFPEDALYVSYNGKSYDSHLINSRFLLNRIDFVHRKEIDLLYISRRLWKKKLENCRLGTIEEKILMIERGPDIPGSEIPDVWFDFLKTGNLEKLKLVFSHNLQDIYSLAILLEKIEDICESLPAASDYDALNLSRMLLLKQKEKGIGLLRRELENGDRPASQFLSLYYKKTGEWDSAVNIWKKLNRKSLNLFASVELAKFYEHREKAPEKALILLDRLLKSPFAPQADLKEKLLYRKRRLVRKIKEKDNSN